MKIALITTINRGGTMQLTVELYQRLINLGHEVHCYIPEKAEYAANSIDSEHVFRFSRNCYNNKINAVISELMIVNDDVKTIAAQILEGRYDCVLTTDTALTSIKIIKYLGILDANLYRVISVHDVLPHPVNKLSLRECFFTFANKRFKKKCLESANMLLFFSNYSNELFDEIFPGVKKQSFVLPLGAHIPPVDEEKPLELSENCEPYFLFFGRIEKYKGLRILLKAFNEYEDNDKRLVIAGNGRFTDEELQLANNQHTTTINRFINDGEMLWLIKNAKAVVLPYIEASQSGVIPIAYSYKVPVITSNVIGLTQFVNNNDTGLICNCHEEYISAFQKLSNDEVRIEMSEKAGIYYLNNLDWEGNLIRLIERLQELRGEI